MTESNELASRYETYIFPESKPGTTISILAAAQHIGLCLVTLTFPRIVGEAAGLSQQEITNYLQLSFLALGVSTLLKTLKTGNFGLGLLLPSCFTLLYLPGALVAAHTGGIGAVAGMTICAGVVETLMARYVRQMRFLLPPEVIGVVILTLGLSLALYAINQMSQGGVTEHDSLITFMSLGIIIGLSVWGRPFLASIATLAGIAAGAIITLLIDLFTTTHSMIETNLVPLYWPMAVPSVSSIMIPGILTGALGCLIRSTGDIVASEQIYNPKWKRPDYALISRGIFADGLGTVFAGLIGVMGTNTYSGSVGLIAASRIGARRVGYFVAAGWILLALTPGSALILVVLPKGVLGAALFYVSAFVIKSGISILSQRLLDTRKTILIGTSLALGIAYDSFTYRNSFVHDFFSETASSILVAMVSAIFLNLIFRIGVRQNSSRNFAVKQTSEIIQQFINECGRVWGARSDVILKASAIAEEVNEYLKGMVSPPDYFTLKISFNELAIIMEFIWQVRLGERVRQDPNDVIDEIPLRIIRHYSDRLVMGEDKNGLTRMTIEIDDH